MTQSDKPDGHLQQYLATSSPEIDFALALARTLDSVRNNPGHLRDTVYELARVKLLEQAAGASEQEARRLNHALELAINRVEAFSLREAPLGLAPPPAFLLEGPAARTAAHIPVAEPVYDDYEIAQPFPSRELRPKKKAARAFPIPPRFFVAATVIAGVFAALVYLQPKLRSAQQALVSGTPPAEAAAAAVPVVPAEIAAAKARLGDALKSPSVPLPTYYGIFAVSDGQLFELEPLLIRAPDQRINISAIFNTESQTILPNGKVQFVVFRRDLTANAPNRVSTRVVAKVRIVPGDGKPATENSWAIRNIIAHDFRVAPVMDNPEMLAIKPESEGFTLSPGRYALVLRGQAFDFTVAGPVTDGNQCIEQIQASNGLFYTQCKS